MTNLVNRVRSFVSGDGGTSATEYAVMLSLIVLAAAASITLLGTKVNTISTSVAQAVSGDK